MKVSLKNVLRVVFYATFTVFVFLSGVLIAKPSFVGSRVWLCSWAYQDIFHPVEFEKVKPFLCWQAWQQVWSETGYNSTFVVLDVVPNGEELFRVDYQITKRGETITASRFVHIHWKPWCYDLPPKILSEDGVKKLLSK